MLSCYWLYPLKNFLYKYIFIFYLYLLFLFTYIYIYIYLYLLTNIFFYFIYTNIKIYVCQVVYIFPICFPNGSFTSVLFNCLIWYCISMFFAAIITLCWVKIWANKRLLQLLLENMMRSHLKRIHEKNVVFFCGKNLMMNEKVVVIWSKFFEKKKNLCNRYEGFDVIYVLCVALKQNRWRV